jgi:hypothetical protein
MAGGVTETEMSTQQNEDDEEEDPANREAPSSEDEDNHPEEAVHHYFQHQNAAPAEHENERYYLRSYLKDARRKLIRAYSEQILPKGEYDLFRVAGEDLMLVADDEEEEEDEENPMNIGEDEKVQFRQQLYGDNDDEKNVIIDDDEDL